jgi:hypothetical protein
MDAFKKMENSVKSVAGSVTDTFKQMGDSVADSSVIKNTTESFENVKQKTSEEVKKLSTEAETMMNKMADKEQ